jgi:hypothetical protein
MIPYPLAPPIGEASLSPQKPMIFMLAQGLACPALVADEGDESSSRDRI